MGNLKSMTMPINWSRATLQGLMPQAATNRERMMKGAQALKTWPPLNLSRSVPRLGFSPGNCQLSFGCDILRKITVATIETRDESMSGSSGPRKLDDRYWVIAKEPPLTKQAGHTSRPFLKPDMRMTRYSGMRTLRN